MAITILERPPKISKIKGAKHPITYKLQRKDNLFNQVNNVATFAQLKFNGTNIVSSYPLGTVVYFITDNGVYGVEGIVTAVVFSAGNTLVTLDTLYISSSTGFSNRSTRVNYRMLIQLYTQGAVFLDLLVVSPDWTGYATVDVSSIQNFMEHDFPMIMKPWGDLANVHIETQEGAALGYYINYAEATDTIGIPSYTSDSGNPQCVVLGARQLPNKYGNDFAEFALLNNGTITNLNDTVFNVGWANNAYVGTDPWVFAVGNMSITLNDALSQAARRILGSNLILGRKYRLTIVLTVLYDSIVFKFKALFHSGPVALGQEVFLGNLAIAGAKTITAEFFAESGYSFIDLLGDTTYPSHGVNGVVITNVKVEEITNRRFLTNLDELTLFIGLPCLLSVLVDQPNLSEDIFLEVTVYNGANVLQATYSTAQLNIESSVYTYDITNICNLSFPLINDNWYLLARMRNTANETLTEFKKIKIKNNACNSVCLIGRNSLGGMLSWAFEWSQDMEYKVDATAKAKNLTLTSEYITTNEWEALQDFITPGDVYNTNIVVLDNDLVNKTKQKTDQQLYIVREDYSKVGVVAANTRNRTRTIRSRHIFELEVELPERQ